MITNPFTDSRNISMRLIRSPEDCADGEKDDQVVIVDQGDDFYHVYFRDGTWVDQESAHMIAVSGDELDSYLENFFFLLTRDSQPFRSIQLNIPCMPIILLPVEMLKKKSIRVALFDVLPSLRSCIKVKF